MSSTNYAEFLRNKTPALQACGAAPHDLNASLFPFQRDITAWAIERGRAAIWADTGLGKTRMQLEWANQSGATSLIVTPLAVAEQTIAEAEKMGLTARFASGPINEPGIWLTNYQKLHKFTDPTIYDAIVLDESSILASIDGKTRTLLIKEFSRIPRRLCCTATPAPNDIAEIGNHAEFLGIATRAEMLASFFVHDADSSQSVGGWRLKGHAQETFWRWVAKWAVYVRTPSDIGHSDEGYILPPLNITGDVVTHDAPNSGTLFPMLTGGIHGRIRARRDSLDARIERAVEIIRESSEQWLVWHGLNREGELLAEILGDRAVLIDGSTADNIKIAREQRWRRGDVQALITKPSMFGFGLNWQHCHNMIFLGLSDSWQQYYQGIRREWRFGQLFPVNVRIIVGEAEREVVANIRRKEQQAAQLAAGIISAVREAQMEELHHVTAEEEYVTGEETGEDWRLLLGDSVEELATVADKSVGLSVFSPPFASLFTYSASARDMGNSSDHRKFFRHFRFLIPELLRVTMPGRRACVHVQQVATTKSRDGVIGWTDFRATVVKYMVKGGWIYDGEVVVDKDPQAQAIRTKSKALMFVQKNKDSSWSRPAMADYILLFRAPGDNPEPVLTDVSNEEWIQWARPIWYNIRESDTLNAAAARDERDEKHICPLQLGTIERCVRLWSNKRDIVLDPFAGIASTGVVALRHERRFVGCELKPSYFREGVRNLNEALQSRSQMSII